MKKLFYEYSFLKLKFKVCILSQKGRSRWISKLHQYPKCRILFQIFKSLFIIPYSPLFLYVQLISKIREGVSELNTHFEGICKEMNGPLCLYFWFISNKLYLWVFTQFSKSYFSNSIYNHFLICCLR